MDVLYYFYAIKVHKPFKFQTLQSRQDHQIQINLTNHLVFVTLITLDTQIILCSFTLIVL